MRDIALSGGGGLQVLLRELRPVVVQSQKAAHGALTSLFQRTRFDTTCVLLDEAERSKHLLNGLEKACKEALLGEDARALCPEVTVSSMLKEWGNALLKFFQFFEETSSKPVEQGVLYSLPSDWWDGALSDVTKPISRNDELVFEFLTLGRNEFICYFIRGVCLSFLKEVAQEGGEVSSVVKAVCEDTLVAESAALAIKSRPEKPLIRCEGCEKSAEELEPDTRFMVCSTCKAKLNFSLHYCSQKCQKDDWCMHRMHCGKKAVSKCLPGTAGDIIWGAPQLPAFYREQFNLAGGGPVDLADLGPGTPQFVRSAALQRQAAMLEADKAADYFLFDASGEPVRVVIDEHIMKAAFRFVRMNAMSRAERKMSEYFAQYLIKVMGAHPGLGRDVILRQFAEEYGDDVGEKLEVLEKKLPGEVLLERMANGLTKMGPRVMNLIQKS
ncbi:hypothetical protein BV22DRAFT_1039735 [Leucogyrophana mollusca]|uniref:Uncharacterized protein n=1 Tax=Leucogyrophana mollusca TaxID=85980 RepID=A0ACB8B4U3_9AGAM|nr:hypothetical protein BV22DRAFT_1039735 [Leucogyrophana mollusca]